MKEMNDRTKTLDSHPEKICLSEKTPLKSGALRAKIEFIVHNNIDLTLNTSARIQHY